MQLRLVRAAQAREAPARTTLLASCGVWQPSRVAPGTLKEAAGSAATEPIPESDRQAR